MKSQSQPMEWIIYVEHTKKKIAFKINYLPLEESYSIIGMYSIGNIYVELTKHKYIIYQKPITIEEISDKLLILIIPLKRCIEQIKNLSEILDKDFDIVEVDMGDLTIPEPKEPILKNVTDINDMFEALI